MMPPAAQDEPRTGTPRGRDARDLAVRILQRHAAGAAPIQALLHEFVRQADCAPSEAALCSELCYGTLRMEIRLRWLMGRFLKQPEKLPPRMRIILLAGMYALLFLEGMPAHAAVDWAVERVKRAHGSALSRVANGCLRALCREGNAPHAPDYYRVAGQSEAESQALYHSLPLWIVRLWRTAYSPYKAELLMAKSAARPAAGLRVNRRRADWENVARRLEAGGARRVLPACLAVPPELRAALPARRAEHPDAGAGAPDLPRLLAEGRLSRQGAGSQLALHVLHPENWPEPIWDACAGQGAKSCALLEGGARICLASDTHLPRLRRITEECGRLDLAAPALALASALHPPLRRAPGSIMLDVPCSGLGVLASRPDIRRRSEERAAALIPLQAGMLEAAYVCLPAGGHIAYLTCTQNPAENEEQIRAFLRRHPAAVLAREWNSPADDALLEGMYAALLVRG